MDRVDRVWTLTVRRKDRWDRLGQVGREARRDRPAQLDRLDRKDLLVQAGENRAVIKIDFLINLWGKVCMILKFGPGSIVTRRRPLLAASRILAPYQIPIAVVTNGEDAEVLEGSSGRVISRGLETIPSREQLVEIIYADRFCRIPAERAEMESRILYCYEVDGSCPCDENVCKL